MKAVNIKWDIDEDDIYLPTEVEIPINLINDDEISNYLSDITGYCHYGFDLIY